MNRLGFILGLALSLMVGATGAQAARPLLMISIDGLRPGDVLDAKARGVDDPNLQRIAHDGAYAEGVRNALPTVTYPNHTTLVTGAWPALHGIVNNTTFDPLRRDMDSWYWYSTPPGDRWPAWVGRSPSEIPRSTSTSLNTGAPTRPTTPCWSTR